MNDHVAALWYSTYSRAVMQKTLDMVHEQARSYAAHGTLPTYIPALAQADASVLALAVTTVDGELFTAGPAGHEFTMQSISKALALAYTVSVLGEDAVFSRVGKEPTGDPFNSIIRLETSSRRKPFNPFINAGAIVVSSLMPGGSPEQRIDAFCEFLRDFVCRDRITVDTGVYESERATAARNRSIAWFLKELKLIDGDVEETLDVYFRQCAILMNAVDLSRVGAMLAQDGWDPLSRRQILKAHAARVIKSLMITCGLYDGSGEFAVDVGIPAKSGVGGGIMAAVRDRMGVGVYGPALDERGNSTAGLEALRCLSNELRLRVL